MLPLDDTGTFTLKVTWCGTTYNLGSVTLNGTARGR